MIAVIDYGMGNLRSVQKAFEAVGANAEVTRDPDVIRNASAMVLPGVGAAGYAMDQLRQRQFAGFVDVAGGMMGSRGHPGWIASGLPVVTPEVALAALPTSLA